MKTISIQEKDLSKIIDTPERTIRQKFSDYKISPGRYDFIPLIEDEIRRLKEFNVTKDILASVFGVSEKTITDYQNKGYIKKNKDNTYNLPNCLASYLQSQSEFNKLQRTRRLREELKLQVEQEKYIPADEVELMLAHIYSNFKSKLHETINKIAVEIEFTDEKHMEEMIRRNIESTMLELSKFNIRDSDLLGVEND